MAGAKGKSGTNLRPTPLRLAGSFDVAADMGRILDPADDVDVPMPERLTSLGKIAWPKVYAELRKAGVLDAMNEVLLRAYVEDFALWCDSLERVETEGAVVTLGNGCVVQNPRLRIANAAHGRLLKLQRAVGMMPAGPGAVRAVKSKSREVPDDDGGKFLALRAIRG